MKKVAIFTAPQGHASIARAIKLVLEDDFDVSVTHIRDRLFNLYTPLYQFVPQANKVPYVIGKVKPIRKYLKIFGKKKYDPAVSKVMKKDKPALAISTHYMYLPALEKAKLERGVPLLNIVTDPWSIHPLLINDEADNNLVFDKTSVETVKKSSPKAKSLHVGWLVQPEFKPVANTKKLREKLGLNPNAFTVVFSSGSEGTLGILNFVPSLLTLDTPCQFVVLCGTNKRLALAVTSIGKAIKRINLSVNVIALPHVKNVFEYYAAADLVAGKAGPNTIFEAVACHKPFLATTHVHGQEDGNLALIKHYGLGYVEENLFKAARLLVKIIHNPELLEKLQSNVQKMATFNALSSERLLAEVNRLVK